MDLALQVLEQELEHMNIDLNQEYRLRCEMEDAERNYELAKERYEHYIKKREDLEKAIQILREAIQKQ